MDKIIFIRYSELSLKGKNKNHFIKILVNNIKNKIEGHSYYLKSEHDKIIIKQMDNVGEIIDKLKLVIGISWFTVATQIKSSREEIIETVIKMVRNKDYKTFRISAKNTSNIFTDSMDLTHCVAGSILEKTDMKVSLSIYDVNITIRVNDDTTTIYVKKIKGIEGLPVGSNGRALSFLSGGIDSPVAAFKMMTRGLQVDFITFISPKVRTPELIYKINELAKQVNKYNGKNGKLYIVDFQLVRKHIKEYLPKESYRVVFLRRFFAAYGNYIADKYGYVTLITGDAMGQVASQTPQNLTAIDEASKIFISRPLLGMDKNSIIKIAREINTYDISILPGEDMCSECNPKNPIISARMDDVIKFKEFVKGGYEEFDKTDKEYTERKKINV